MPGTFIIIPLVFLLKLELKPVKLFEQNAYKQQLKGKVHQIA